MTIRGNRGYVWESKIVDIFNKLGFVTTRLGGTTIIMPDVSAHKDDSSLIISIECKSTVGDVAYVPGGQIQRCIDWGMEWGLYQNKMVLLAFKFGNNGKGKQRKGREYLKIWNQNLLVPDKLSCRYDGICFLHGSEYGSEYDKHRKEPIVLEEFV